MKVRALLTLVVASVTSAAIWALSSWMTGHHEPWDADGFYYVASLPAAGLVSGAIAPRPLWAHYVGSVAGQAIYELLFLQIGPLFLLGLGFLLGYSILFLAGAFVGSRARLYVKKTMTSGSD
jgi:hypothetical protein